MARIHAGVLGVYGESDARIGATIPATDSTMRRLHKDYFHNTYAGTALDARGDGVAVSPSPRAKQLGPLPRITASRGLGVFGARRQTDRHA